MHNRAIILAFLSPLALGACATILKPEFGISEGRLYPCPATRACISSQDPEPGRRIEPLAYTSDRHLAKEDLLRAMQTFEGVRIVSLHRNYLRAEFPSKALRSEENASGYYVSPRAGVDDVEFYFQPSEHVIHVRSTSRVGVIDRGENRERIEQLRRVFETLQKRREQQREEK